MDGPVNNQSNTVALTACQFNSAWSGLSFRAYRGISMKWS